VNFNESWEKADGTVFEKLNTYLGTTKDVDAFRGLTTDFGVERPFWSLRSGGLALGDVSRYAGTSPAWCNFAVRAEVMICRESYEDCLRWAGKVIMYLRESANMTGVGYMAANVQLLCLSDFPAAPEILVLPSERVLWRVIVPMQLVFTTEAEIEST
jgi:hypothetical protein